MLKKSDKTLNISLKNLLDIPAYQKLSDTFSQLTGMTIAILDLEGRILISSGWKNICTIFHRTNPDTALRCLESDTVLAGKLAKKKTYNIYKCKNGLVDVAVPIIIEKTHVGNLFTGQFFFDPPNLNFFSKQAEKFGFNKDEYLKALSNVPIFTEEKIKLTMNYLTTLTEIIGKNSLDKIKLFELNEKLEERVKERTAQLEHSNERFKSLSEAAFEGIIISHKGKIIEVNDALCRISGYQASDLINKNALSFVIPEEKKNISNIIDSENEGPYEVHCMRKDGSTFIAEIQAKIFSYKGQQVRVAALRDISKRKHAEEEIKQLRGILPICSFCKKIRDDEGYWEQVEVYVNKHSEADFSHSICPDCLEKYYPDLKKE